MGLAEAWKAWQRGEPIGDSLGYIFVSDAEIERGRKLDSQLEQLNREAFEAGVWSQDEYDQVLGHQATSAIDYELTNPETSPWGGFKEGFAEGASNVQESIRKGLSVPINWTLGAIPWQIWLILFLVVAWKLGWLRWAIGKATVRS